MSQPFKRGSEFFGVFLPGTPHRVVLPTFMVLLGTTSFLAVQPDASQNIGQSTIKPPP